MPDPTIVTLTAIPPRFGQLEPTLNSLKDQSLPIDEIRLHIPETYRRFPDWDGSLPTVPDGVRIFRSESDYGPATKLLPAVIDLKGQSVDILFCDDDKLYDRNWYKRFNKSRQKHPDACIVEVGETFPDISDSHRPADRLPRGRREIKDLRYRLIRILSLTLYKPHLYRNSGYVDQISGYGGVMVRPEWFDDRVFDIPDILWTVDDPWISGHLERLNVPIWLNGNGKQPRERVTGKTFALGNLVELGHDRVKADMAAIDYFRETYGIWQPVGEVDQIFERMTDSMKEMARRRVAALANK